jgi:predicted small secreted protein
MFKKILASLLTAVYLSGLTITLAACNTMAGVGEDVSRGGEKIKEEANEHKRR